MPGFNDGFLGVPARPGKPRADGLTHVMDKGLNLRDIEGMFDTAGEFVDIVKLGWGTSYVTNNLEKKIALYRALRDARRLRRHALRGRLRARQARRVQGVADRAPASRTSRSRTARSTSRASEKLELIADFARDFTVLSEVGSKDSEVVYAPVPVGASGSRRSSRPAPGR